MKLLIIVSSPAIGGGEKYLESICRGLVDRGHEVTVACSENLRSLFLENGATVYGLKAGPKLSKSNIWQLVFAPFFLMYFGWLIWRLKRTKGIEIIHVQYKKEQIAATLAAKALGVKVVWTEHGPLHGFIVKNPLLASVYRAVSFLTDRIIVVSEATKRSLHSIGIPSEKLMRIYNGVTSVAFHEPCSQEASQRTAAIIARLIPDKGHFYLLKAFKIVRQKVPDARLLMIGDGPLRSQLDELVRDWGLADIVSFLGQISQEQVQEVLDKTGIVVMPSVGEGEGLPYAVLEAMARGKPVIATCVGGLPELVIEGVTGIIVPPRDCDQLAGAIVTLMQDPTLAHQMGRKGKERVESEFSDRAMIDQTEKLLLSLTKPND